MPDPRKTPQTLLKTLTTPSKLKMAKYFFVGGTKIAHPKFSPVQNVVDPSPVKSSSGVFGFFQPPGHLYGLPLGWYGIGGTHASWEGRGSRSRVNPLSLG